MVELDFRWQYHGNPHLVHRAILTVQIRKLLKMVKTTLVWNVRIDVWGRSVVSLSFRNTSGAKYMLHLWIIHSIKLQKLALERFNGSKSQFGP